MMKGKTVMITGANSGIGKETAKALAIEGAEIVMACRDLDRAQAARAEIVAASANEAVRVMQLDLASLASVKAFTDNFNKEFDHLDVLINNAGLFPMKKHMSQDGFELQFAVNHLGHFLLTQLLLPQLQSSKKARIINVASMLHNLGKIDFHSFRGEKKYNPLMAYAQSKLANVLFTRELAKRFQDTNISAYSLHPGAVGTNIAGRSFWRRTVYKLMGGVLTPNRGARTSVYLAHTPDIERFSGGYFDEFCRLKSGSKRSQDSQVAAQLWSVSDELVRPFLEDGVRDKTSLKTDLSPETEC